VKEEDGEEAVDGKLIYFYMNYIFLLLFFNIF
jgi:hypothetical protein